MATSDEWDGKERRHEQGVEILNLHRRMDNQDAMLADISKKMTAHLAVEETVKPSVDELVKLLNGIKFLRGTILIIAPVCVGLYSLGVWIKEHVKWVTP